MQKKSELQSALEAKCPRCHKGDMFIYPFYNFAKFDKMHRECPSCGLNFEVEPGFFIGAMYISYAICVVCFLAVGFILFNFFNDPPTWVYVVTVPSVVIVLLPLIFRYSRVIYLYLFGGVQFNDGYLKEK